MLESSRVEGIKFYEAAVHAREDCYAEKSSAWAVSWPLPTLFGHVREMYIPISFKLLYLLHSTYLLFIYFFSFSFSFVVLIPSFANSQHPFGKPHTLYRTKISLTCHYPPAILATLQHGNAKEVPQMTQVCFTNPALLLRSMNRECGPSAPSFANLFLLEINSSLEGTALGHAFISSVISSQSRFTKAIENEKLYLPRISHQSKFLREQANANSWIYSSYISARISKELPSHPQISISSPEHSHLG